MFLFLLVTKYDGHLEKICEKNILYREYLKNCFYLILYEKSFQIQMQEITFFTKKIIIFIRVIPTVFMLECFTTLTIEHFVYYVIEECFGNYLLKKKFPICVNRI